MPFAAGGAVGAVARVLSTPLTASLGQAIVIDNRGGAGGIIGMDAVAKAPADGYTLLLAHSGLTYMPGLYRKLPFDPVKDFDGVITAVSGSYVLAVSADAPFKTVAELIAYAKANPGKLTYALGRHRLDAASRRRVLQARGRHRHPACALQGRGAGDHRSGRRPGADDVRARWSRSCRWRRPASSARWR